MSFFPVKVRELVDSLKTSGAFDALAACAAGCPMPAAFPEDGKTRLLVCSPSVNEQVAKLMAPERVSRTRVAVPGDVSKLFVPEETMLEVYSYAGQLRLSIPLPDLDEALASALEAELARAIVDATKRHKASIEAT